MFKRLFLSLLLLISQQVFAQEIMIKITPKQEYSTCSNVPQVGDFLEFVTTEDVAGYKKGTLVKGLLTQREENGFSGKVASFYIEQFRINGKKLQGIVSEKGNEHPIYFEYFDWLFSFPTKLFIDGESSYVRGGEAFLKPNENIYTLFLEG